MLRSNTGNRTHDKTSRANDSYETPAVATRSLLAVEALPQFILEPAAGSGQIVRELRRLGKTVAATELTRRSRSIDIVGGVDFMTLTPDDLVVRASSAIITNPPFKIAEQFVAHALTLCPTVCVLLRTGFIAGLRWKETRDFGRHCSMVWQFSPRLPMFHRQNWTGPKNENSAMDFAWYVFRRDCNIDSRPDVGPRVGWINWRDHATEDELTMYRKRKSTGGRVRERQGREEIDDAGTAEPVPA